MPFPNEPELNNFSFSMYPPDIISYYLANRNFLEFQKSVDVKRHVQFNWYLGLTT